MIVPWFDAIVPVISTALMGVVGWAFKRQANTNNKVVELDKRLALLEQSIDDLKELINARFDSGDQRLERIERSMNGFLRH